MYLLKEKSKVAQVFKIFHKMVKTQFQTNIQIFRTDNGTEYFNQLLGNFYMKNDITHQSSYVDTP